LQNSFVNLLTQNIFDLLTGNKEQAIQRSEEFRPEVESVGQFTPGLGSTGLASEAQQEVGNKVEAVGAVQGLLGLGKQALGFRGNVANARDLASQGVPIDQAKLLLKQEADEARERRSGVQRED
jgi:hypothetical protein